MDGITELNRHWFKLEDGEGQGKLACMGYMNRKLNNIPDEIENPRNNQMVNRAFRKQFKEKSRNNDR